MGVDRSHRGELGVDILPPRHCLQSLQTVMDLTLAGFLTMSWAWMCGGSCTDGEQAAQTTSVQTTQVRPGLK